MIMSKSLIMPDGCLIVLAKLKELLNLIELIKFLEPWHNVSKYTQEIFQFLKKNCLPLVLKALIFNFLSKAK